MTIFDYYMTIHSIEIMVSTQKNMDKYKD